MALGTEYGSPEGGAPEESSLGLMDRDQDESP